MQRFIVMNFKAYILGSLFIWIGYLAGMETSKLRLRSKLLHVHHRSSIYNRLPKSFKKRPIVYYRSLMEQYDKFSCGHRLLFHALSIERAAKKAKRENIPLEKSLSWLLKDQESLSDVWNKISSHINETNPSFDQRYGLYAYQLFEISQTKLPMLKKKLIPVYLKNNNEVMALENPDKKDQATIFCQEYLESTQDEKFCKLHESTDLPLILDKLQEPFDTAHFACLFDDHWILATCILNEQTKAELLVFDPENNDISDSQAMRSTLAKLLDLTEQINKTN